MSHTCHLWQPVILSFKKYIFSIVTHKEQTDIPLIKIFYLQGLSNTTHSFEIRSILNWIKASSNFHAMFLCLRACARMRPCRNSHVCTMGSAHSDRVIKFANGTMMSERLFRPLSSGTKSIVLLWDYLHHHLYLGLCLLHRSPVNMCFFWQAAERNSCSGQAAFLDGAD